MLKISVMEGTNIVSITVAGSISAAEDDAAQQMMVDVAAEHGTARILLDYKGIDWSRVEPRAVWEDLKGSHLLGDVDRIGVLTGSGVPDKIIQVLGALPHLEVRTFATSQRDAAVTWLSS